MRDRHVSPTGEFGTGKRRDLGRDRRLAHGEDFRDRMIDRREQVRDELGVRPHECRVVVGLGVVGAKDEPFEVVDVGVEPVGTRPSEDRPCRLRRQGRVQQQLPEPARTGERHRPDEPALITDDRPRQTEVLSEAHRR